MKKIFYSLIILPIIFIVSCTEKNDIVTPYSNTPVVAYTQNAFAYTLAANNYTSTFSYDVSFNSDSLAYSLVVSGYKSGDGVLTVFMEPQSSYAYSEQLKSNKVISFTQNGVGTPRKVQLEFNNFSGSISFSLARSNGN